MTQELQDILVNINEHIVKIDSKTNPFTLARILKYRIIIYRLYSANAEIIYGYKCSSSLLSEIASYCPVFQFNNSLHVSDLKHINTIASRHAIVDELLLTL